MKRARVIAAVLCFLGASCGETSGFIRDSVSLNQRQYRMNVVSEQFIRTVSGDASNGALFCMIPLETDMYKRAMDALYAHAMLGPNQVVLNLREDHEVVSYLGFFCKFFLTVSGDVVQFTPAPVFQPGRG